MNAEPQTPDNVCTRCGAPLVTHKGRRFCVSCLLKATSVTGQDRIGPYLIDSLLGEGGMGEVYLAFHETTGRAVALKVPAMDGVQPRASLLKRFAQEAHVMSLLDHPGILPIYEVGEEDGRPWFAMKLAEGGTLADHLIDERPLPAAEAARMLATIASAVQHAHNHGILHRDLKPHNILLDESGQPMLGDFGLARHTDRGTDISRTLAVLGTPGYAAPEVIQGSAPSVAGDIFSLGAIFYHLLAGRSPFKSNRLTTTLELSAQGRIEPLTRQGVPLDLWRVCRTCLEPEPEDRYATAADLERDLRSWLNGSGVSVRPLSPLARLSRLIRRKPMATALILTTALAIIASLVGLLVALRRVQQADAVQLQAEQQIGAERRHLERLNHIRLLLDTPHAGHRREALDLLRQEWAFRPGETLRGLAIRALAQGDFALEGGEQAEALNEYARAARPSRHTSPASGRSAIVGGAFDRELRIVDAAGRPEVVLQMEDSVTALQWNDAGDKLAIACLAKNTLLWSAGETSPQPHIRSRESTTIAFAWHPDERLIACLTEEGALHLWDLERRQDIVTQRYGIPARHPPRWDNSGAQLHWSDANGNPQHAAVTLPTGVRMLRHDGVGGHRETFCTLDLDAQHGLVSWVTEEGAWIWDFRTGTHRLAIAKFGTEWMGATFTTHGLSACGWSSGLRGLGIEAWRGGQKLPTEGGLAPFIGTVLLAAAPAPPGWLALLERPGNRFLLVHPDSRRPVKILPQRKPFSVALTQDARLAATSSFQESGVNLWTLPSAAPLRNLPAEEAGCNLMFAPDGRTLATVGSRLLNLWDVSSGEKRLTLTAHEPFRMAAWSPDGKLLAVQTSGGARLHRARDGALLAELSNPGPQVGNRHVALAFDRQQPLLGEQLEDGSVILWDFTVIARELQQIGMDWPVD